MHHRDRRDVPVHPRAEQHGGVAGHPPAAAVGAEPRRPRPPAERGAAGGGAGEGGVQRRGDQSGRRDHAEAASVGAGQGEGDHQVSGQADGGQGAAAGRLLGLVQLRDAREDVQVSREYYLHDARRLLLHG